MNQETKICQNCKNEFRVEPEDFAFYEKIKVPAPTFCPNCRLQRRLAFSNVFRLYKRKCDLCGKETISRYSSDKKYRVYCPLCWWGDKWDGTQYGRNYDFSKPFFQQFMELWREVPLLGLSVDLQTAQESPYNNDAGYLKQCYFLFSSDTAERCAYGYLVVNSYDCVESTSVLKCELLFDSLHAYKDYSGIHLFWTNFVNNSAFLFNSENCQNCFASANLRNKQYCFFNKQYTKEEYAEKIKEFDLGSHKTYEEIKEKFRKHILKYPMRVAWYDFSKNVSGILVFNSKNCQVCFDVTGVEDSKFVSYIYAPSAKDCYDYTSWGKNAELVYEGMVVGENVRNVKFGDETGLSLYDADYTKLCVGSANLLGCIGLKHKSYCILNKQYTEEEYKKLVPRIIKQMDEMPYKDKQGREYRYGEFFPIEISPFAYNETLAEQWYPLPKTEALRQGYLWKDEERSEYKITVKAQDLPDHIKDAEDSILQEVIGCGQCGRAFRLIPQELEFYRKMNVPLPRQCFFCRLKEKMDQQPHPLHWFKRKCQCDGKGSDNKVYQNTNEHSHKQSHCHNEFESWYNSQGPEIVYCEQCYKSEVI